MKRIAKLTGSLCISIIGLITTEVCAAQLPPALESYSRRSMESPAEPRIAPNEAKGASSKKSQIGAQAMAVEASLAGTYSSDLQNIVTSCESDPKKLFDFVRNNIRFTPYFGFRKGPDLTWLTRSG